MSTSQQSINIPSISSCSCILRDIIIIINVVSNCNTELYLHTSNKNNIYGKSDVEVLEHLLRYRNNDSTTTTTKHSMQ